MPAWPLSRPWGSPGYWHGTWEICATACSAKPARVALTPWRSCRSTNLSGDPEQEYFVDGITEALITDLAKIRALKVIARPSSMRYKDTDKSIAQIAGELGVQAVISGSVLRSGDQVRVTARLIEAETDRHLWADSFDRELRDILALYSDVARAIAQEVEVAVTPEDQTRLAASRPVDPAAYELYAQGRYQFNRKPEGLLMANELFQRAVDRDPGFAQAYAALAYSYIVLKNWNFLTPGEVFPKAKAAALRAQELDEALAETQKALAAVDFTIERDWPGFEKHVTRALESNSTDWETHQWYAEYLSLFGRHEEAVAETSEAWELDPYSPIAGAFVGRTLYWAGQYDRAVKHLQRMIERDPGYGMHRRFLSFAHIQSGRHGDAIAEMEKLREIRPSQTNECLLAYANAVGGRSEEAWKTLRDLKRDEVKAGHIALVYSALGEEDEAFAWLEKAFDDYDSWLFHLQDQAWDPLRDDPRFRDLLRRLNLPVEFLSTSRASARREVVS